MLDELATYGNNALLKAEAERGNNIRARLNNRRYTQEDYEGFRAIFGKDEPVVIEPESDEPFARAKEREKFYENPETGEQLYHLERWGFFYK